MELCNSEIGRMLRGQFKLNQASLNCCLWSKVFTPLCVEGSISAESLTTGLSANVYEKSC